MIDVSFSSSLVPIFDSFQLGLLVCVVTFMISSLRQLSVSETPGEMCGCCGTVHMTLEFGNI